MARALPRDFQHQQAVFHAEAPGSLMLFGEHAVLYGKHALVAAINLRVFVTLKPRCDTKIILKSNLLATTTFSLTKLASGKTKFPPAWRFVIAAIQAYQSKIPSGFELNISSEIPATFGFGSSAAVTSATCAVLHKWLNHSNPKPLQLLKIARGVIQKVQGLGSGADCAASILGGVVAYKMAPLSAKKIADSIPLTIIYSGSKMKTPKVIKKVSSFYLANKKLVSGIFNKMDTLTLKAAKAIPAHAYKKLGKLMDQHQELQQKLLVSNKILAAIILALRTSPHIYGAKISGAGLGDSVIGLGKISRADKALFDAMLSLLHPHAQVVSKAAVQSK